MSPRRILGIAAIAASVAANGGIVLHGASAAVPCVTHEDPAGDAYAISVQSNKVDEDADLDILGLTLNNTSTELIANITVKKLAANPGKAPGHGFEFGYTFAGKKFEHSYYKYGQAQLDAAAAATDATNRSTVAGTTRPIPVTATFDLPTNTVTLKVKLADLEPWSAAPVFNAELTALTAGSSTDYYATAPAYDTLSVAEGSYRVRYGCGPDVVDLGNPPAPPVRVTPDVAPRAGCALTTDKKGDGTPIVYGSVMAPNEPDLDIVGLNVNTTSDEIKAHIHVDKLGDKPANFTGDRFEFTFGYLGKTYLFAVGRLGAVPNPAVPVVAPNGAFIDPNHARVNGTIVAALKPTGTFDKATNTVVIAISRAALDAAAGEPVRLGAIVTGVGAKTWGYQPGLQFTADTATNAADTKYVVGYSRCFLPPEAKLTAVGSPTVQYSDTVTLSAKLEDEDGKNLSGKTVTFTLGGRSTSGTTNSSGVATAPAVATITAGAGSYTISFAGDSSAGPASITAPITVAVERTKLTAAVVKKGSSRIVTATLKDDDGTPLAGQTVAWTAGGKSVGTAKTDSLGRVVLKTAKPTQTVIAKYSGATDKYAPAQVSLKV